jgi:hypothetical protein
MSKIFHCGIELETFMPNEFVCPCCGEERMQKETLQKLQRLRNWLSKPMRIVEGGGYRCPQYETSQHSAHREGRAVDPGIQREDLYVAIQLGMSVGFKGVGVKNKDGRWQLHLDDAANLPGIRPRPWMWTY